ncbi:hypothetical protein L6164_028124 [Bauhinia variegata]|uniref:Uncharacterized protein n=1 Tax=Bauhinia variegata TaxID=167791 RepID=A0ACB9LWG2_BAUVA|nr:hypothetical protein L6164_028124 [Bauhinia variegata]
MIPISSIFHNLKNSTWFWFWNNRNGVTPLFLAFSVILVCAWYFIKPKRTTPPLPPGPRGIPILGNLLSLDPELHSYFADLGRTYGPILKIRLGTKIGIVVSSPSIARQVLKDQDTTFANRDMPAVAAPVTYGGLDIAWTPYGPQWRMLRKVCALKMLSNTTLDSVYALRRREIRQTVAYTYTRVGSPVNVGEQIFLTILNVITNMMWGGTVEGDERASLGAEFRELISDITELLGKPNISDFFPGLAPFDLQGMLKKMRGLSRRFDGIFEKMIDQRLKINNESSNGKKQSQDFLQFLINLKDEGGDSKTPFTMTHLKALLMDMVVGGSDTSSNTIEFVMAEIMNNPEVTKRAQQELAEVVGQKLDVSEKFGIVLKKKTPLVAIPTPRLSSPALYE